MEQELDGYGTIDPGTGDDAELDGYVSVELDGGGGPPPGPTTRRRPVIISGG